MPSILMNHSTLDPTQTNSTPSAPMIASTCHTNDDQLLILQQNPSTGTNQMALLMTNTAINKSQTLQFNNCHQIAWRLFLHQKNHCAMTQRHPTPWQALQSTTVSTTLCHICMPTSTQTFVKHMIPSYSILGQSGTTEFGFIKLGCRTTQSGALQNIYNTFGYSFPDETLLTSHTAVPTQIQCSTNTNDTTALLPAITSQYQPLSPIAYDGGRPGPPWPLPTKSLHVYIPTASTDTSTGLQ